VRDAAEWRRELGAEKVVCILLSVDLIDASTASQILMFF